MAVLPAAITLLEAAKLDAPRAVDASVLSSRLAEDGALHEPCEPDGD